jgi:hypothetical protein
LNWRWFVRSGFDNLLIRHALFPAVTMLWKLGSEAFNKFEHIYGKSLIQKGSDAQILSEQVDAKTLIGLTLVYVKLDDITGQT